MNALNSLRPQPAVLNLQTSFGQTLQFSELLAKLALGRPGIYIYTGNRPMSVTTEWLYVGQTSDCNDRPIGAHEKHGALSRYVGVRLWFCAIPNALARSLAERDLIKILQPSLNKNLL